MKRSVSILLSAILIIAPASRAAKAHKFHASFMTINYNPQARTAAITMRFFPDDLRGALTKQNRRAVRLEKSKEAAAMILEYLKTCFAIKGGETPCELSWVDMDLGPDSAFMYFVAKVPDGLSGARIRDQFLFELFDDQVNVVTIKYEGREIEQVFRKEDTETFKMIP